MTEIRERRGVFGEAVDAYEAARPGYPDQLVTDVIEFARLDGAPVLEVGAGTGKASVAFARRGLALTCVEADARMAAVLARTCEGYPNTSIVVSGFEQWRPPADRFGLLFSAQAWHWIDPASRWSLAFEALRPGAAIALFWNRFSVADPAQHAALTDVHARHGAADLAPATLGEPASPDDDPSAHWPEPDVSADGRFQDFETRTYSTAHTFTGARYADLLASISAYRLLPEAQRTPLLTDIAHTVDALPTPFTLTTHPLLHLARTRTP
ncbi:class I SAM-dependent methyltransferase [Streptacidiphilus sp. PB12-B1b]|uniref:class I SAM-dependent methyltransferase n=1 Tax=Streptacidiphilus sp. PB12-B1b TaxID=2705012 RepID=UPI0015FC9CA9|nr:class I SAM-dependent methyltransferase [Streptacidiphilus sp. PB12-B1b]QMU75651.1 class I SAM-dependent methyltransferase [Streptacidiphilus sp. PB12-B1b]